MIDDPKLNDNRKYDYSQCKEQIRGEYLIILNSVQPKSKVIDLGCGNGSLLKLLIDQKECIGKGLEISETGVNVCMEKGLNVFPRSIDCYHADIKDKEFDYAISNVTMQMVMYPEILLKEMGRIAVNQIISFPNFAYYENRIDLLAKGRMPKPMLFGYEWYNTGHIHQLSYQDFINTCVKFGFKIIDIKFVEYPKAIWKRLLFNKYPNLFSKTCIFFLKSL